MKLLLNREAPTGRLVGARIAATTLDNTELLGGLDNLLNASVDDRLGSAPGRRAFVGAGHFS